MDTLDTFEVKREDNCIWIKDLREERDILSHIVPEQAQELIDRLQKVL